MPYGLDGKAITINWSLILRLECQRMVISLCVNHGQDCALGPGRVIGQKCLRARKCPKKFKCQSSGVAHGLWSMVQYLILSGPVLWSSGLICRFWLTDNSHRSLMWSWAQTAYQQDCNFIKFSREIGNNWVCFWSHSYHHELLIFELVIVGAM